MRIVSLVPHATELLFALGLGDQVVGVTHECDHPAEALERPHVTSDRLPPGLDSAGIDAAVRSFTEQGEAIYGLDEEVLGSLRPDLIVTQALCPVCAVSYDDVRAIAERMDSRPQVISLDPRTYGETLADVRTVATATEAKAAGVDLIARTARRVDAVRLAVRDAERRPRVAAIEWFDPVFVAGHWTPQLIEMAGGIDVLGFAGEHSEQSTWEVVAAAEPDVVIAMPCGYDAQRAHEEAVRYAGRLRSVGAGQVVAVDAAATFSRPGPRLVDGLETLAHILHPERVPSAPGEALTVEI
jgi:iron complex transport system substrate-binding protein